MTTHAVLGRTMKVHKRKREEGTALAVREILKTHEFAAHNEINTRFVFEQGEDEVRMPILSVLWTILCCSCAMLGCGQTSLTYIGI